jgi:hypothetical protein
MKGLKLGKRKVLFESSEVRDGTCPRVLRSALPLHFLSLFAHIFSRISKEIAKTLK